MNRRMEAKKQLDKNIFRPTPAHRRGKQLDDDTASILRKDTQETARLTDDDDVIDGGDGTSVVSDGRVSDASTEVTSNVSSKVHPRSSASPLHRQADQHDTSDASEAMLNMACLVVKHREQLETMNDLLLRQLKKPYQDDAFKKKLHRLRRGNASLLARCDRAENEPAPMQPSRKKWSSAEEKRECQDDARMILMTLAIDLKKQIERNDAIKACVMRREQETEARRKHKQAKIEAAAELQRIATQKAELRRRVEEKREKARARELQRLAEEEEAKRAQDEERRREDERRTFEEDQWRKEKMRLIERVLRPKSEAGRYAYYQVLGVSNTASAADIQKSFRSIARKLHPDKDRNATPNCDEAFKVVNEAYQVLKDAVSRQEYDRKQRSARF